MVCGLLVFLIQTPASPLVVTGGRVALGSSDWPTYHGDQVHSGLDSSGDSYSSLTQDWTQTLDGSLFASPVVAGGKVIEATENNSVYAFNVVDGSLAWKSHLASPVQSNTLPCGNISPTSGITGTPVVDTSTGTIYVVAYQAGQSGDDHILFALDLNSGSTKWSRTVNPVVGTALAHQQRGALALGSGKVYIPYGGLDGDCGDYHGALIGVNADGSGTNYSYTVSSREAGMWNAAGPSIDGSGNVFTVTGNGDPSKLGGQESVIKVSPTLQYEDSFTASNWSALDQADTDLGSLGVSLLDNNLAFTAGKGGTGYLLNQTALGGVGGQIYSAGICSSAAGGSAYQSPILYVPCTNGVTAVKIDPVAKNFSVLWTQSASNGSPIVAGGMVWALSGGNLVGMDPITGHVDITRSVGGATRFATPASSGGRLFIALNNQLLALAGPAVRPPDSGRPWPGGSDAVGAGAGSTNAYFAEGFTGPNFHEYLTVENPGAAQTLTAIYDFASGSQLSKTYSLGANSRTTIDVNGEVGYYQQVSTHLSAPNPFVAERPMYFDFPGGITGGDDAMGVQAPGQQFYFAEGYT
ncbi:MAG TPA: PQQ-binding-like beta-propeller repeat protein, partial [Candidatus Dormibacteraeota bacterium]|nr:PQQ-binding-like beta-propeller repeat protein [Candidatus Dormibacteraeota bacterium]